MPSLSIRLTTLDQSDPAGGELRYAACRLQAQGNALVRIGGQVALSAADMATRYVADLRMKAAS
ncbi:hypothetical protein Q4543_08280 [Salipiger sp. 1_MG-2023]|uniref:hypothetical protein n=1 Tax=Salipiger sp. 1_MG-2023 TaxID=3062665 RepID=UPI0026E22A62|nr:hypothetical protein [Salipiger sp. 1_MG-2023]MDO6585514.1 hypothetical protein [Salipiger sp. 1_MG-2023]